MIKLSLEKEPQSQKQEQETEQQLSLAELSRQYLNGKVGLDEYLALERQMTPRFGEAAVATLAIEEEIKSTILAALNHQQTPPRGDDSESRERITDKDGNE